jgi:hypothetical protein
MALEWLVEHNPLYQDVQIYTEWDDKFCEADKELYEALVDKQGDGNLMNCTETVNSVSMEQQELGEDKKIFSVSKSRNTLQLNGEVHDNLPSDGNDNCDSLNDGEKQMSSSNFKNSFESSADHTCSPVGHIHCNTSNVSNVKCCVFKLSEHQPFVHKLPNDLQDEGRRLSQIAYTKHLYVVDVKADGNCQFHAIARQLSIRKIDEINANELRRRLVLFLKENYVFGDVNFKEFVGNRVVRDADSAAIGFNDTAEARDLDIAIDSEPDLDRRLDLQWKRYLDDLGKNAWGDNITLIGISEIFKVNIQVYSAIATYELIMPSTFSPHTLNLGLVSQYHYLSLEPVPLLSCTTILANIVPYLPVEKQCIHCSINDHQSMTVKTSEENKESKTDLLEENSEHLSEADQQQLDDNVKLRGIPYSTCIQHEDLVYAVAPSEGQKPCSILDDSTFEVLAFPHLFPRGKGGFHDVKKMNSLITNKKYFIQRVMDCDGRFCKDIEYILAAQYASENKFVFDHINIALRQSQGAEFRGLKLNAGLLKNSAIVNTLMQRDHAYKSLSGFKQTITL